MNLHSRNSFQSCLTLAKMGPNIKKLAKNGSKKQLKVKLALIILNFDQKLKIILYFLVPATVIYSHVLYYMNERYTFYWIFDDTSNDSNFSFFRKMFLSTWVAEWASWWSRWPEAQMCIRRWALKLPSCPLILRESWRPSSRSGVSLFFIYKSPLKNPKNTKKNAKIPQSKSNLFV